MYTNFCLEYLKGPRRKWYNIKIDVKEARHEDVSCFCEDSNDPLGFVSGQEVLV